MNHGTVYHQLSESQKSIWYLEKAYPGTSLNIVAGTLRLKGEVNYPALEKALNIFVKKSDSMRIRIKESEEMVLQYVSDYQEFAVDFFDFSRGGLKDLFTWDEENTRKPFIIADNQLFYTAIFKVSDEEGGFHMKMHHLISDAWTMGLITRQVIDLYAKIKSGEPVDESQNPSYIQHLINENEYERSARFSNDKIYWSNKFETMPEMTFLKPQISAENSIAARRKTLITPLKLSNKIREFCSTNRLSIFTLFMSALAIYINRVTGTEDIVLGTTILNRTGPEEKETSGMFISVAAPIRITVDDSMDFKTFAGTMLRENMDVLRHQKYPYNYLLRDLKKKHKLTDRLFDIVLSFQNSKFHKKETDEDYVAKWLFSGYQVESLIISINDREDGGNLIIDYDFLTEVYDIKEIEFIHQNIISLLWHALDNPMKSISKLDMISEKEKQKLLYEFNDTPADYPREKLIHQVFEEQTVRTPDNIAMSLSNETMTYRQLNERANRLARTLRAAGVKPDTIVGVIADRSFEMVIALLSISKAAGAFMPIDPDTPADRIRYMLENSGAEILLATITTRSCAASFRGTVFNLDAEENFDSDASDLPHINKSSDLAYVIYTSGSTGQPKGVMTEHRNVIGLFKNDRYSFDFDASDVWTFFHSYCFDLGLWEMYGALLFGAKLVLIPADAVLDINQYLQILKNEEVTMLVQTPQFMLSLIHI